MTVVVLASVPQVALETVQPMLLMVLINAIVAQNTPRVWTTVLGLVGLIPIYITGNFLFEYMASRVGASVSNDMRMAAFWRLQALSVGYHRGRSRGDLLSRFSSDLDAVERSRRDGIPLRAVLSPQHRGRRGADARPSSGGWRSRCAPCCRWSSSARAGSAHAPARRAT